MQDTINLLCFAGCIIPIESPSYPAHRLTKKGLIKTTIVKCTHKIHAPNTGWNYTDQAMKRMIEALKED